MGPARHSLIENRPPSDMRGYFFFGGASSG
jgi:hypothetical protein